jgi:hypothetical protein
MSLPVDLYFIASGRIQCPPRAIGMVIGSGKASWRAFPAIRCVSELLLTIDNWCSFGDRLAFSVCDGGEEAESTYGHR